VTEQASPGPCAVYWFWKQLCTYIP